MTIKYLASVLKAVVLSRNIFGAVNDFGRSEDSHFKHSVNNLYLATHNLCCQMGQGQCFSHSRIYS